MIELIAMIAVLGLVAAVGLLCWSLRSVSKRAVDAGEAQNYLLARMLKPMADVATANGERHLQRMTIENERIRSLYEIELSRQGQPKRRPLDVADEDDPQSVLDRDQLLDEDILD